MISVSIAHTPWKPERVESLALMRQALEPCPGPLFIHDTDYRGRKWYDIKHEWALGAWKWHLETGAQHCLLLSDDLHIMPRFWDVLNAMLTAAPENAIGLMSNHPDGPRLWNEGRSWYRTCSWLVGPAILMPRTWLSKFVAWYEEWYPKLPDGEAYGQKGFFHDDSSINEWITRTGRTALHPLPAPIEHRLDMGRTGNPEPYPKHAAEWISWRRIWHENPGRKTYATVPQLSSEAMYEEDYWHRAGGTISAPLLEVV